MFSGRRFRVAFFLLAAAIILSCASRASAQDDELGDDAADPIRIFNLGQEAHARKDYERAIELYEEAVRLRPEFPDAEYQRGAALASLGRAQEAEAAYRRAFALNPKWALPYAALGSLLLRAPGREREAEAPLRRALELDPRNVPATASLAESRRLAGDPAGAAALWRRATEIKEQDAALWLARGRAERAAGDPSAAARSYERALALDQSLTEARLGRAAALVESGRAEDALTELRALEAAAASDHALALDLANLYGLAGRAEDARRIYERLPEALKNSEGGKRLSAALGARCDDTPEALAALEQLVERDPRNASALACLGSLTRTTAPERSLGYYRRASALDPQSADYAVGFAAALVQLRRYDQAAAVLRRVVEVEPDNYAARANLASALYAQKLYKDAIVEYKWLSRARPDLAVIHFFLGTSHDQLGEYEEALASYEAFVSRADPGTNQLEIDKVNLRLPSLRNQVRRGEGVRSRRKAEQR